MLKLSLFLFCVINFSLSKEANLKKYNHYSPALKKEQSFIVYIPEKNAGNKIIFLLHGAWGNYKNWTDLTEIENIADKFDLTIVMPDGGEFSWYNDSPVKKEWQYESYFVKELIPFVDSIFNNKKKKGICGLSMGGYGSFKFAGKYPKLFKSASSLSGALNIIKHKTNSWSMDSAFGSKENYSSEWQENNLFNLLEVFRDSVKIKFDIGIDDHLVDGNKKFESKLNELKIPHEYKEYPGKHNWEYWGKHIEEHLEFHSKNLE